MWLNIENIFQDYKNHPYILNLPYIDCKVDTCQGRTFSHELNENTTFNE